MKHAVSVAELLELHRLGELYVKWASTPFAMSEADVEELQEISEKYSINGTSALYSFQKQFQREFGLTAANTISVQDLAKEVLAVAEAGKQEQYADQLVVRATEITGVIEPVRDEQLEALRAKLRADNERVTSQLAAEDPDGPHAALQEQIHEVDREAQAAYRADQLRSFRAELDGEMADAREIEILRDLSNVDELTEAENDRLDELVERAQLAQDSGTHKIPVGVVQDAISTGHIQKSK